MVSLGASDRSAALKVCVRLTAHMDRMLDENLHNDLPTEEVAAFFKAELRRCVGTVRRARLIERMDGSLTAEKARRNLLETLVLRGMVEDGLREKMAPERLQRLEGEDREVAQDIQRRLFREFLSPAFNSDVRARARAGGHLSQLDVLQLRWAAVEARMAAHEAVDTVPLHSGGLAEGGSRILAAWVDAGGRRRYRLFARCVHLSGSPGCSCRGSIAASRTFDGLQPAADTGCCPHPRQDDRHCDSREDRCSSNSASVR